MAEQLSTFLFLTLLIFLVSRFLVGRFMHWWNWDLWYRSIYLTSLHWRLMKWWKKLTFRLTHHGLLYCEKCMRDNRLHIHHVSYKRLGHERLSDLQVICAGCHRPGGGRI